MNIKRLVIPLLLMTMVFSTARAQETIMNDLSYLYMEKLVAVAKANYPRVQSFNHRIEIAKSNVASQKLSWLDPIGFSYVARSNRNTVDIIDPAILTGYQFGISINPGSFLRKPGAIKTAKEELKISLLEQKEYELQLESEVKRRYLIYLQSLNNLRLQTKMVMDAESVFKDLRIREEYNNASMSISAAYQGKISAETSLISAKTSLEELLVKKLEEIK